MTQATRWIDQVKQGMSAQPTTAWLGSTQGGLQWLFRQIENNGLHIENYSTTSDKPQDDVISNYDAVNQLDIAAALKQNVQRFTESGTQRIICGLRNRADLDRAGISTAKSVCGEIPIAFAVDTWFDGSRRTGLGETGALLLSWSRWWDGWQKWLSTPPSGTLDAWTNATAHLTAPEPSSQLVAPGGLIVADCRETADGWLSALNRFPQTVADNTRCVSSKLYHKTAEHPAWILLDDTADLLRAQEADGPCCAAEEVRAKFHDSLIIVATTISRADQWLPIQTIERCETIAKPSTGRSLRNLLEHYFRNH